MGRGGEAQGWRGSLRAEALLGLDRVPEALATAEEAFAVSHRDGMLWAHARAARILGRARAAAGDPEAEEAFRAAEETAKRVGMAIELQAVREDRRGLTTAAG
jgi:hypothetical protein